MKKESAELHVMWHIDALLHLYPVTIVTTVDTRGIVNAAPYSLVLPFCSSPKNPQMLLIVNRAWHTAKNIEATGEFVINYPRTEQLRDIVETSRHYGEGVNELERTSYSTMPANNVRPPRIAECYQHIECRVHEILKPSHVQINVIADVLDLSHDEGLYATPRAERSRKINLPVYLGVDEQMHHVFGNVGSIDAVPVDLSVDE